MSAPTYDLDAVRAQFPALVEGAAHFDGPGGSQTPSVVADAVAGTLCSAVANRGIVTAAEQRAEAIVQDARGTIAALLNGDPGGIAFGPSMTALAYKVAYSLAKTWRPGDEVVVTRLDHDGHVRPWVQAAQPAGVEIRWADFDPETGELPVENVTAQLSGRTKLVAVTGASNLLGTRPDVRAIGAVAHDAGALFSVDGVHLTPHAPVDVREFGADFYFCSAYKFFGPHLGILATPPQLLESLRPDKLLPQTDAVPERFETGTLPYEQLAGAAAAVRFIAGISPCGTELRQQLIASLGAIEQYEAELCAELEGRLAAIAGLQLLGHAKSRTPTLAFVVDGIAPAEIYKRLAQRSVNAPAGTFYAYECARRLGIERSGAVRAGLAPYTSAQDVDRLVEGVRELVRGQG